MTAIDLNKVKADALKEVNHERVDEAKEKLKRKYRDLAKAQKAVRNVEREIEDCLAEIGD